MSWAQVPITPSFIQQGAATPAGQWTRGVPTFVNVNNRGFPPCSDVFKLSPPNLLNRYDIYSHAIGWALIMGAAAAPTVEAELAFLVNDDVRYVITTSLTLTALASPAGSYTGSGAFVSDLVNPLGVGGRERLSLRIGWAADQATSASGAQMYLGAQLTDGAASAYPSTISYNVIELPGARRL